MFDKSFNSLLFQIEAIHTNILIEFRELAAERQKVKQKQQTLTYFFVKINRTKT